MGYPNSTCLYTPLDLHSKTLHHIPNATLAHASCLEVIPPFPLPGLILTLETSNPPRSVNFRAVNSSPSNKVPSVKVIELGDALGLLLAPRRSFRVGTTATAAVGAGG